MTLKQLAEKRREQFMEHVSPKVKERLENPEEITLAEWKEFRGNSYERKLLHKKLSNEAFIYLLEYCMGQAGYSEYGQFELSKCYNDAVTNELVPEMIKRFKKGV